MNETLYSWTFKFHKVVRQQNSGAAEDFILLYSAVYPWIQRWKNYWSRSTFAKVIVKIKVAPFLMAQGVVLTARCTTVQSAVLRLHVVCPSVCPFVTLVDQDNYSSDAHADHVILFIYYFSRSKFSTLYDRLYISNSWTSCQLLRENWLLQKVRARAYNKH